MYDIIYCRVESLFIWILPDSNGSWHLVVRGTWYAGCVTGKTGSQAGSQAMKTIREFHLWGRLSI